MCALAVYDGQMSMLQAVVFGIGYVVSKDGTDEFQIVRIILSNVLSLCIVLLINRRKKGGKKHGGRKDFTGGR